jgi:photosystem II stability/assembly factor-like uncharacterized protein
MRQCFFLKLFTLAVTILASVPDSRSEPALVTLGPFGGDVRSLIVHPAKPDRFFLGTADGQIYVSPNRGEQWRRLSPGLGRRNLVVDNLVFHPNDPDILFAACWELKNSQGWLFKSEDAGENWLSVSLGAYHSAVRAIAIAPSEPDVIALGISEGVILSTDGGKSWQRISRGYRSLYNVESMAFDPRDSETLYVGTWRLGFKTNNRGAKWEPIHDGMTFDSDMFSLLVNPDNPRILYASACTGIYRSDSAGAVWNKLTGGLPKDANRTRTLLIDPIDSSTLYAGTTVGLFLSKDGGVRWSRLIGEVVVNTISVHPTDNRTILVGTDDAGVLRSTDGGTSFEQSNAGFIHRQIADIQVAPGNPSSLYAAVTSDAHYGGFFYSADAGRQWYSYNEGLKGAVDSINCILALDDSSLVFVGTRSGVFEGIPPERPWRPMIPTNQLRVLDLAAGPGNTLFIGAESGIYHLDVKLQKLRQLVIPVYKGRVNAVLYDPEAKMLFAAGETGVLRSPDGGKTWAMKVRGLPYSPIYTLEKNGDRIFCGTRQGLFFTDNQGEAWTAGRGVLPLDIITIRADPRLRTEVFAADMLAGYVFHSADGGTTWEVVNLSKRASQISRLAVGTQGELFAGTLSEGVYLIEPSTTRQASGGID